MRAIRSACWLVTAAGTLSCGSPSTSSPSINTALVLPTTLGQLENEITRQQGNTLQETLYYCGSDDSYDYYIFSPSLRPLGPDLNLVDRKNNDQPNRFGYTNNPQQWICIAGIDLRPTGHHQPPDAVLLPTTQPGEFAADYAAGPKVIQSPP